MKINCFFSVLFFTCNTGTYRFMSLGEVTIYIGRAKDHVRHGGIETIETKRVEYKRQEDCKSEINLFLFTCTIEWE